MASVLQHGKVVQIRSRAVFNLPERYQYVSLNVCSKKGHPWSSNTTAVVRQKGGEGTALIDFWARLPADNGDTSIEIELHPEPKPGKFKLFEKSAYAEKRRTTLRVPHTFPGPGEPPVWHRAVISLEPKLHTHTQIAAKIKNDLRRIDSVVHGGAREVTATLGRHHERLANTVMGGGLPRAAAGIEMVPVPEGRQGEEGAPASTSGPPVSGPVSNASLAQRPSHWEVVSSAVGEQPSMLSITPVMDHDAGEIVNIEDFDIPPPEAGAVILVEFCAIRLDRGQARLPELELGKGLHRSLHCYAHGGFMGCALSLLADPEWEYILLSAIEDQEKANSRKIQMAIDKKVVMAMGVDGLSPATTTLAKKEELIFMNVLENSPTLCAYGLTRSGCCGPAMAVSDIPPAPSQAPSLASTWWMSHRPNSPIDPPIDVDSLPEDHVWQIFPTVPKARRPNLLLETHRCVWSPAGLLMNRYGYSPIALEWDLWLDPANPSGLAGANVDHGSAMHLVQQAIAMSLQCHSLAKSLGKSHNKGNGVTPLEWLKTFGTALSSGVMLNPGLPLPLHAGTPGSAQLVKYADGRQCPSLECFLELTLHDLVLNVEAEHINRLLSASELGVRMHLRGNAQSRPPVNVHMSVVVGGRMPEDAGDAAAAKELDAGLFRMLPHHAAPSIYPVSADMSTTLLVLEVYNLANSKRGLAHAIIPMETVLKGLQQSGPGQSNSEVSVQLTRNLHLAKAGEADTDVMREEADQGWKRITVPGDTPDRGVALGGTPKSTPGERPGGPGRAVSPPPTSAPGTTAAARWRAAAGRGFSFVGVAGGTPTADEFRNQPFKMDMAQIAAMEAANNAQGDGDSDSVQDNSATGLGHLFGDGGNPRSISGEGNWMQIVSDGPTGITSRRLHDALMPEEPNTARMVLSVKRTSVIEAAERIHGIDPVTSQSCIAMLAAPGGLYLDVKSGYSKARELKWFASTLAGIGINAKAICSFVPSQIDFSKISDTQPWGMDPSAGVRVKAPKVPNIAIAARPSLPVEKPVLPGFARARTDATLSPQASDTGATPSGTPGGTRGGTPDGTPGGASGRGPLAEGTELDRHYATTAAASTSSVARRCNAPTSADPSASTAAGGCGASDGATPTRSGYDDLPQAGPSAPSAAGASGSASRGSAGGSAWGWRRGPGGAVGEGTEGDGGDSDDGGDAVSGWARSRLRDGLDSPPEPEPAGRQPTAEQQQQQQAAWLRGEAARTPSASSPARAAAAGPLGGARDPDANDPDAASREGDLPGHIVSPTGGGPTTSAGRTTPLRGSSTPSGDNPRGASPGTPSASLGAYGSPATPPPPHHQSQSSRAAPAAPAPAGAPSNDLPGDGTWRKLPYDSVLFYHGLNGMQLACESGKVAPGTCILFNGATLLHEQFHEMLDDADQFMKHDPDGKDGPAPAVNVDYEIPDLVDMEMWRRYCTLVQVFQIYTGVYIQEPDASAPAVCAIIQLCNSHPGFFPLGFAYGHLSTKAVAVAGHEGRGLANQALLEELNSREKLGGKVCKWISMGVHLGASDDVYISWGRRVLYGPRLMDLGPQQLLLQLLADYPDEDRLPVIVNAMGGLEKIFLRFFNHYDAHSAFTLWELGFNFNYTKALLRLLRNRNYMALMDHDAKLSFVRLLLTPPRTGDRSTSRKTHYVGRGDMHKLCKEAVLCMFESCTSAELTKLIEEVGGLPFIHRRLRGWLKIQGRNYVHRLGAVLEFHWSQPEQAAFKHVSYGYVTYARPPELDLTTHNQWWDFLDLVRDDEIVMVDGVPVTVDTRRTRPKGAAFKFMRLFIKVLAWLYTVCWNVLLTACCPLWMCCCLPTLCAPYCRGIWIPLAIATGLVVVLYLLQVGAVIGGVTASEAGGGGEDPLEIDQHLRMRRLMEAAAVALLGGDGGGGALTEE